MERERVCVREAVGGDLEPIEYRVGSRSVASRSVHTAPRNYPRKPNENRKKKEKEHNEWTPTGSTLCGCVPYKWNPGTGICLGAETNSFVKWQPAQVAVMCKTRREPKNLYGDNFVKVAASL